MAQPKVLEAINELDSAGFLNNPQYLGDIRTSPTCLDSTLKTGFYTFTGGTLSPKDLTGSFTWSLRVYSSRSDTAPVVVIQLAERIAIHKPRLLYTRNYGGSAWTDFVGESGKIETRTLALADWVQDTDNTYYQTITITGLGSNDKVDFDADMSNLKKLKSPILSVNESGTLKAVCTELPSGDIALQLTIYSLM